MHPVEELERPLASARIDAYSGRLCNGGGVVRNFVQRDMRVDCESEIYSKLYGFASMLIVHHTIRNINEPLTRLVGAAHSLADAPARGYVIEAGLIVASGSSDELRADEGVRKAYLGY